MQIKLMLNLLLLLFLFIIIIVIVLLQQINKHNTWHASVKPVTYMKFDWFGSWLRSYKSIN